VLALLKEQVHLDSPLAQFALLAAGVVWLWRRPTTRGPRWYFTLLLAAYWFAATPFGADILATPLAPDAMRVMTRDAVAGIDTIVLLGGGVATADVGGVTGGALPPSSLLRTLEAARVANLIGARLIIASGGIAVRQGQVGPESRWLRAGLIDAGVRPSTIVEESQSKSTYDQAQDVAPLLRERGARRFVLVTSPAHMRRALAVFRRADLDPVPSMTPLRSDAQRPPRWFMPNDTSLRLSDESLYEYAAIAYYKARGWM